MPARKMIENLVEYLEPVATNLGCRDELAWVRTMVKRPNGAERQKTIYQETGDMRAVVETMIEENGT